MVRIKLLLPLFVLFFILTSSGIPGNSIVSAEAVIETQTRVIILFERLPATRYRVLLNKQPANLTLLQRSDVNAYTDRLRKEHSRFLSETQRGGIELEVLHEYTYLLNGLAVLVDEGDVSQLAKMSDVSAVFPDSPVHLDLNDTISLIGADQVWAMKDDQARNITGLGVRVAIIDTGVDYTHPDLGGCFGSSCKVVDGYDLHNNDPNPLDDNGHGTHCAGVVGANGTLKGVAPGASLFAYKVLDAYGSGNISVIIAGIERAADPDQDPGTEDAVDIISLSLGYRGEVGDPWSLAVEAAADEGILVVVSAGNNGPGYNSLDSPGLDAKAFTVGASDKSDLIATFSSRGVLPGYPELIKPDILAPGVGIVSTFLDGSYASANGTSMATPHVAGAAALVWQFHPEWTAKMVQANLMNTSADIGLNVHTQGTGRIQVDTAITATAAVTPGSIGLGLVDLNQSLWSVSRALKITNISSAPRTYSLSVSNTQLAGVTALLSSDQLTLAAGQNMNVTLTVSVDTSLVPPDLDRNQGLIQVQSGDTNLKIPFAFQIPPLFIENRSLPYAAQTSYAVELGDLDGDGDLDAFIGNSSYYSNPGNTVWVNNGQGMLTDNGQRLGDSFTWSVSLGDLDGDGDLDAFVANGDESTPQPNKVWLNDGSGIFQNSGQSLGNEVSRGAALGDLDGDGDLDAFVANGDPRYGGGEPDHVWVNDGSGSFANSGQNLGKGVSQDVALGDLDGDGDLDAFVAQGDPEHGDGEPNRVWLNDGHGIFTASNQSLGNSLSQAVALGDLDGDGDLDAFVANGGPEAGEGQPDRIWLNNGTGFFSDSGQSLGFASSFGVALADLHKDGRLDAFVAGFSGGNRVWLNDGHGQFSDSSPGFGSERAAGVALGDMDHDDDVDALVANTLGQPNRLWLNRGAGPAPDPPAAPSGLIATGISENQIQLDWNDHAADETAYIIERSPDGEANWGPIATIEANAKEYIDANLNCETRYFYRVRAYRAGDDAYSAYSNLVDAETHSCEAGTEFLLYIPYVNKPVP